MAYYNNANFLTHENDPAYNVVHSPGAPAPFSGIYRCQGCGHSAVSTRMHPLPPQNHHEHTPVQGTIRWQLIVKTTLV